MSAAYDRLAELPIRIEGYELTAHDREFGDFTRPSTVVHMRGAGQEGIGEAGPGPSYLDEDSGGPANDFTNRNTTFMTWNLLHLARMLKDAGGIPAHGNQRSEWEAGCRFDFPNPEHR